MGHERQIPGVGDVAASALSAFLLYQAYRLGVPRQLTVDKFGQVIRELTADELAHVSGGITIKQKIAE